MSSADQDPPFSNGSAAVDVVTSSSSSSASAVFRKIEFHPARRPFMGFSNGGSDFKMETLNPSSVIKRPFSSTSVTKPDGSDLWLDPELSFSVTFRKIGAGLENLGNTCFLNSVLQCLTYTEPLAVYLQKVAHENRCHVAGFCALCAMQKHVRTARQATGRILAPKDLVTNLRCVSRNFRNCRQEDAHEYMINLLECMHKCSLPSGVSSQSSDAYRSSLVHRIFGGSLRSQVQCSRCSHCSNKFDPFLDLSLDISKAGSLQEALSRFTEVELLDDGAKVYQCERCRQKVKAKKQLTVSKAPYVLTVHLKRFEAHRSEKIDRKVHFPSVIDMKPYVSGPSEGNLKYTLYGVLVHYGRSSHSGHYACFVRTSTGMWYSLDDNRVRQVGEKTVFDQKAYMLFYVRDRQNPVPKITAAMPKKDISKESVSVNKASLVLSPNRNGQVNGSTMTKASGLGAVVSSSTVPLKPYEVRAPSALSLKGSNDKEAQKDVPSSAEAKNKLKRDNWAAPLKPCNLGAPNVLVNKDLNTKETFQKEVPLPRINGERPLVKEESKAACAVLPGKASALPGGSTNTQIVDEKNYVNNMNEPANSLKVMVNNILSATAPIQEHVLGNQTLGQHSEETATSIESLKPTSHGVALSIPRKTRKRKMKTPRMGLTFFKLSVGVHKKKKQISGKSSTLAFKINAEELLSKSIATDQEHCTSKISSKVASGSTCLHGKDDSVSVHTNGDILVKERTNKNGAVLEVDQQQPLRSSDMPEASQNGKRKREALKEEQISIQKKDVAILTRGLPETVVAKWDEEVSAPKVRKSKDKRIGYVADEWDEEYDRGKKKKIRMKEEKYEGPNPFQLVASKKQKETKKKWTQRMNTAKKAFRR
ncbi:unnamed protein product [Cochlearia groenlandica]